jgi:DNA-binding transcriptional LysR family regulator
MSAALARLRDMFGDQLLMRVGREYQLTPLAKDLVGPLQATLASLEATLERRTNFEPRTSTREFKIASSDYVLSILTPPLLAHFNEVAPGIRLHLRVADSASARKLTSGRLDLSIQPSGVIPNFPSEVLFKDKWVCAVWSGNKAVSDPITVEEWAALPHACFAFGKTGVVLADLLLGPLAEMRTRQVLCESFLTMPLMLPNTRLLAMLPARIGSMFSRSAEIRLVQPPKKLPAFSEAMTWNPLYDKDPAHTWLREQVKTVAERHLCVGEFAWGPDAAQPPS